MNAKTRRTLRVLTILLLWVAACGVDRSLERRPSVPNRVPAPARPVSALYGPEEALRDMLSGSLLYLGTGPWPGNGRMHACAFRNQRVIVVNVYCSIKDSQAFRLEVYAPKRGRVRIYAESKAPVSARTRQDYFTFTAESEPPPAASARLGPLDLSMSFDALRTYDEARQAAYLPACYGGLERQQMRNGCLGPLAPQAAAWSKQNRGFLERANGDWYRAVSELRAQAARYGKDPR